MEVALGEDRKGKLGIGFIAELGAPYFAGVLRHYDGYGVPLLRDCGELFEEELCIYGAAGAGDGNDDLVHGLIWRQS